MDRSDFMPNLMCNVTTCGHNKHNLCCKDGIQVGGSEAFVSETTCCESFIEKTKELYQEKTAYFSYKSTVKPPKPSPS